jgi:hypothetical protein
MTRETSSRAPGPISFGRRIPPSTKLNIAILFDLAPEWSQTTQAVTESVSTTQQACRDLAERAWLKVGYSRSTYPDGAFKTRIGLPTRKACTFSMLRG